jgi:two-component system, NarL family, sensor histidine kinase DesK
MPGLTVHTGWLSTVPATTEEPTESPPDSSRTPVWAQDVPGGPRLARAIVLAVLCSYAAVQTIDQLTAPFPHRTTALELGISCLAVLTLLTMAITSASAEGWPTWRRLLMLLASGLVTYLPMIVLGKVWAGMAGFFAGSILLLLSGWVAWGLFAMAIGSMLLIPITANFGPYLTAYFTLATLVAGLVVFGLSRMSTLIGYVHTTRGELAQLAVINERMRFARDLHDLLGYSLSAIALKAELTRRVVTTNPALARDQLAEILDVARQALADTRQVASGYRNISLSKEASSCVSLLNTAGIAVQAEISSGVLDENVDTALATVLREAVTNMLRHSSAQNCSIQAGQVGDFVQLRIINDGVPRGAATSRRGGGLENLATRLEAVGGQLSVSVRDGRFDLLAMAAVPGEEAGSGEKAPTATPGPDACDSENTDAEMQS